MIDNIRLRLHQFRVLSTDNFYSTTTNGKVLPSIDTLTNNECYSIIQSNMTFQAYRLMSHLKTSYGYTPHLIEVRDIPFTYKRFHIIIDLALPKLLYGHNLHEIHDSQWDEVIKAICTTLLQFGIEISDKELRMTSNISRVDYCKNIIIHTPVSTFISLLEKLHKERSKIYYKFDTTVTFGTKKKRLVVYDKVNEIICKASNDKRSITYKLAKLLIVLKEESNIHVIRIEERLYGHQTIVRELKSLYKPDNISFRTLFSEEIASYILSKHWGKLAHENKFKLLLLGEKDLQSILSEAIKYLSFQSSKYINALSIIYPKLLFEIGEESANKNIRRIRSPRSLACLKKWLYDIVKHIPMYDTRLNDYRTITKSLNDWEVFSLPILSN